MHYNKKILFKIALLSSIIFIIFVAMFYQKKTLENKQAAQPIARINNTYPAKHIFTMKSKRVYCTPEERIGLCQELGLKYLKHLQASPEIISLIEPSQNNKYIENYEECDHLTNLYGDKIQDAYLSPISIRWINQNVGYGVFAESDLTTGDLLGEYTGEIEVITKIKDKDYAWRYDVGSTFEKKHGLDASRAGNEMRFVNDSQTHPNCKREYVIGHDNLWHVLYVVIKDIKKGEQCLVRYSPEYWKSRLYDYETFTN